RSDELPASAALGYLHAEGPRTNMLHLPVRGTGDGGMYATVADVHSLWAAFFAGRIVSPDWVGEMVWPRSHDAANHARYGLGFWLHETSARVALERYDAGVSFRSECDPDGRVAFTVVSNWSDGAWPMARHISEMLR